MSYEEIRASFPKAKKVHSCEWCAEKILKGEKHFYRAYKWEGEFHDGRMHMECFEMYEDWPSDELMEGWTPGDYERPKKCGVNDGR